MLGFDVLRRDVSLLCSFNWKELEAFIEKDT